MWKKKPKKKNESGKGNDGVAVTATDANAAKPAIRVTYKAYCAAQPHLL